MVIFRTPDGRPWQPEHTVPAVQPHATEPGAIVWEEPEDEGPPGEAPAEPPRQAQPPPRWHPLPEDRERTGSLKRGGPVNLHHAECWMVTEGRRDGTPRPPHYRGIVFRRDGGGWEALQWNGILRGSYSTRDQAIAALLHPAERPVT